MGALIKETRKNSLEDLLELLQQRIDESIIEDHSISISVENKTINYLNSGRINDYKLSTHSIYLNCDGFELNICIDDKMEFTYEDSYDEYFQIVHDGMEIRLYFV